MYNDYLFYTEDDQHVQAFRYHLLTGNSDTLYLGETFYEADILVNADDKLFYIAESQSTGSEVFCFDLETLELKSVYSKDDYGCSNHARRTFLLDGGVYWSEYRLNASDISRVEWQYSAETSTGMLYVDEFFVITTKGLYLRTTGEALITTEWGEEFEAGAITKSGHIMLADREKLYIFVA